MKSFSLTLLVLFGLLLFGCSDIGTNINSSQPNTVEGKQLVKLPAKSGLNSEFIPSVSKVIGVDVGGKLELSTSYTSNTGNTVTINASLNIPAGAFNELSKKITMTADGNFAALSFSPSTVFKKTLTLNLTYTGLSAMELDRLAHNQIIFVYVNDNGEMTPISNSGITVDQNTGTLTVKNAKIHHFSRYGFAK